jgi:fumarate reductase subunit D
MRHLIVVCVVMVGLLLPTLASAQEQKSRDYEFAMSFITSVFSVVYFPIKLSVALIGATYRWGHGSSHWR